MKAPPGCVKGGRVCILSRVTEGIDYRGLDNRGLDIGLDETGDLGGGMADEDTQRDGGEVMRLGETRRTPGGVGGTRAVEGARHRGGRGSLGRTLAAAVRAKLRRGAR